MVSDPFSHSVFTSSLLCQDGVCRWEDADQLVHIPLVQVPEGETQQQHSEII